MWLDARHVRTRRPSRKPDWKWLGPCRVVRQKSPYVYEFELPASTRIHRVQPICWLDPVVDDLSCLEVTRGLEENSRNVSCNVGATEPIVIFLCSPSHKSTQYFEFDIFKSFPHSPSNWSPPFRTSSHLSSPSIRHCHHCLDG